MTPVDLVAAGAPAVSPTLVPSGPPSAPPAGAASAASIEFAQALIDAQATDPSEVGGVLGNVAAARPEPRAVREARGDARFALWLAMGRAASHATISAVPSFGEVGTATWSATARQTDVGGPNVDPEAASPADHDLEVDTVAPVALPVPGGPDWSIPAPLPGLPQASHEEAELPSDLTRAPILSEPSHAAPLVAHGEQAGSEASPRVTQLDSVPSTTALQAAPDETEASLPHDRELNELSELNRIEPPRARGEVHHAEPHAMPTTTPLAPQRDPESARPARSRPHTAVQPTSQQASLEAGLSPAAPVETATRDPRTEASAPPQLVAKAASAALGETRVSMPMPRSPRVDPAEVRPIDQSTVTRPTAPSRPASDDSPDPVIAPATKRPRQADGPLTGAVLTTHAGTSVAAVTSAPRVAEPTVVTHLETPDADDVRNQIVQAMRVQWGGASGDARIRLQPHYLGELTVSLRVEQGAVSAHLAASSPEVRQWIEANEAVLRQGLAQHELKLERLVVAKDEPAPSPQHEHESEPRGQQPPKRRPRRSDTDATFEVVV